MVRDKENLTFPWNSIVDLRRQLWIIMWSDADNHNNNKMAESRTVNLRVKSNW